MVDYLWSYGYDQVYVIPPSRVKGCRQRYRSSGARTDASDAYMLADVVRTDQPHLTLWRPDAPLTQQMRALVALPSPRGGASGLGEPVAGVAVALLSWVIGRLPEFTGANAPRVSRPLPDPSSGSGHYAPRMGAISARAALRPSATRRHPVRRLPAGPTPDHAGDGDGLRGTSPNGGGPATRNAPGEVGGAKASSHPVSTQFRPDTFASLQAPGRSWRQHSWSVSFGDDPPTLPTQASLQAQAGTCPVTEQSGKHRSVHFRRACDRDFRTYAQQWARASVVRTKSPFACAFYADLRQRRIPDNQAYRCLANRWLAIAWRLWQTHTTYDEAYHLQQRSARRQPLPSRGLTVATTA
ncbi:MAG: transposase [Anaerolineales bacterium]|nr:transposase [Anaerolineales bacterium]